MGWSIWAGAFGLAVTGFAANAAATTYNPWVVDDPTTAISDPTALLHYKATGPNYDVYIADPTTGYSMSAYTDDSSGDVGDQNSGDGGDVQTWIASQFSVTDADLTLVGGGACGSSGLNCNSSGNNGTLDLGSLVASIFFVHFDNKSAVFEYDTAMSVFTISNLSQGVSNIFAFSLPPNPNPGPGPNPVPLPAALPLFGSALAAAGAIGGWRKRRKAA